jgi:pilus assembly protein CpaB
MQDAKRRAIIFTVISVILAAISGFMFLQKQNELQADYGETVSMYVAAKPITARQPLKPSDFMQVPVPRKYAMGSIVNNLNAISINGGYQYPINHLVAVVPLKKGEPLTTNILKPINDTSSGDKRLVALTTSERVFFDQPLSVNDRVDVIVTTQKNGQDEVETKPLLLDKPVVMVSSDGKAIWLELEFNDAVNLIKYENFAQSIRVLKAPQVGSSGLDTKQTYDDNKKDKSEGENLASNKKGVPSIDVRNDKKPSKKETQ